MRPLRYALPIVAATLLGGSAPPAAQGGADQAAIARAALTVVIRPGYAALAIYAACSMRLRSEIRSDAIAESSLPAEPSFSSSARTKRL